MDAPLAVQTVGGTTSSALGGSTAPFAWSRRTAPQMQARRRTASRIGQFVLELPESSWMVLDALLVAVGLAIGHRLVGTVSTGAMVEHVETWKAHLVFVGSFMLAGMVFGLYERETFWSRSRILTRTLLTAVAAVVLAYAVIYVLLYSVISRRMVCWGVGFYFVVGTSVRTWTWWLVHRVRRALLIVGTGELFDSFRRAQDQELLAEYRLVGFATPGEAAAAHDRQPQCLGTAANLESLCEEHHVTDIVVGTDASRDASIMGRMVNCLHGGLRVTNESTFYEKAAGQILVERLTPDWFLFADLKVSNAASISLKRVIDLLVSSIGLAITLPFWALIALLIKAADGGPVFYSQDRVGERGRTFRLYKFRSMKTNAESGESVWASPNDPRVTRVGRWLRKARLDELPQLMNIMRGQMSIVGPRPERPDLVAKLAQVLPYYDERHLIKPGLTGWAQINYKYGASVEDARRKLQYDLYYLKHQCLELDAMILLRTMGTFLRGAC